MPARFYRKERQLSAAEELAVELANRKSIVSYYDNALRMLWSHIKGMNIAERCQSSSGLAYAYGLHPGPVSAVGMTNRGLRYSDAAIRLSRERGDLLTEGHCYCMRSMALYTSGRYVESIESAERSMELLTRAGDP